MVNIDRTGATLRQGIPIQFFEGLLKGVPSEMGAFLLAHSLMVERFADTEVIQVRFLVSQPQRVAQKLVSRWSHKPKLQDHPLYPLPWEISSIAERLTVNQRTQERYLHFPQCPYGVMESTRVF